MEGALFLLSVPNLIYIAFIISMLFSLFPSPLQDVLKSIFSRGKLAQHSSSSSPPKFTVPQRLFVHFYITGSLFNGLLLLMMLAYIFLMPSFMGDFKMTSEEAWRTVFLLFLFELQVLRRLYEDTYVSKFSAFARMHICAYFTGIMFYISASLSLFPGGVEFLMKSLQGLMSHRHDEIEIKFHGWKPLFEIGWLYWLSSVLFFGGWFHQYRCHMILASLRSKKAEAHVYKIPYGDWFEYVSSAHYFAEFLMYFSFVVAKGGRNLDTWLLFAFVVVNLWIAAVETHKWYKAKFENYPVSRKAIIPFVY